MTLIRPPALERGGLIRVVAPSWHGPATLPREVQRGMAALEQRGFRVELSANAEGSYRWNSGTAAERLDDLHQAFADPEVIGIISAIGGDHSAQLLPDLDVELIRNNPKLICGYSDTTALLLPIHEATGLVTFYGPALIPQWGEVPEPYPETVAHFERVTMTADQPAGALPSFGYEVIDQDFARREAELRPRERQAARPRRILRGGSGTGPLLAGCLPTLRHLLGTPWMPTVRGRLLFVELPGNYPPNTADADLSHLRRAGVLDDLAGLVIGRTQGWSAADDLLLADLVAEAVAGTRYPVLLNGEFGHVEPIWTLPIGIPARLQDATVELLEPAVS